MADPAQLKMIEERLRQLQARGELRMEDFPYWDTQPVPKFGEDPDLPEGPIEEDKTVEEISKEPIELMRGLKWVSVDLQNAAELDELYKLLNENYVEDDDCLFRFDYSKDFLTWALTTPGWKPQWHLGIRNAKSNQLLAFISAIPAHMRCKDVTKPMVEINFLCVHKLLRHKGIAPQLISEITRLVNLEGIFQAAYTAGVTIPRPISSCQYFHRSLNPQKLIAIGFSRLGKKDKMKDVVKKFKLPREPTIPGIRACEERDIPAAFTLVTEYLKKFAFAPVFSEEEFKHWVLPRDGVVNSYVVENPETNQITDFCSFYALPSTVQKHETYKKLNAVYSFYNVATSVTLKDLMYNALIFAKLLDYDVFNALHLMENEQFLEANLFGPGDGNLQYYLYNYRMQPVPSSEIGLVLL
eukprot:m.354651 g.354651  ORF g.354651 m.354651 type:complete len:412 (+) comp17071_c0_seq1:150-1385(+)